MSNAITERTHANNHATLTDWRADVIARIQASGADAGAIARACRIIAAHRVDALGRDVEVLAENRCGGIGLSLKSATMHEKIDPDGFVWSIL